MAIIHIKNNDIKQTELTSYEDSVVPHDHAWVTLPNGQERCVYDATYKVIDGKLHVYLASYGLKDVPND